MKWFKPLALSLLTTVATLNLANASFERALETYKAGNYEDAKSAFETMAAIGDKNSLFNLGVMYLKGQAVEQDLVEAYALITTSVGLEADHDAKTAVFNMLSEAQRTVAGERIEQLQETYSDTAIYSAITPKPLNDADCIPYVEAKRKVPPKFPVDQAIDGNMGIAVSEYTISPEGYPRDIFITKASNDSFADSGGKATLTFLHNKPIDGKPVYGRRNQFTYYLMSGIDEKQVSKSLAKKQQLATSGDAVDQYLYATNLTMYRSYKKRLKDLDLQYKTANDWYVKSAKGGLPDAQFVIGRNMLDGRGCEQDIEGGSKWIRSAAVGGLPAAQRHLAFTALSSNAITKDKVKQGITWLDNASKADDYTAKVLLAWELSTNPYDDLINAQKALTLLEAKPKRYYDKVRIFETQAAVHAATGDFKKAIKFQKKAAKEAKKLDWDIPLIAKRLATYEAGQSYRGSYF